MRSQLTSRSRLILTGTAFVAAIGLLAGCTGSSGDNQNVVDQGTTTEENAASGDTVTIGFSGPAADHGWLGAINSGALAAAESFPDVDLQVAEGTNDVNAQIAAVETFINNKVDAIVLLPSDGAALTEVATRAMEAGIPVVNVDREFSSPFAARSTVLGDNYGMGVSAGTYICEQLSGQSDAVVAEIAGIDSLPLTQDRSAGFKDALADCGLDVGPRVAADFTVAGGEASTSQLLSANPKIDAIWNHDDDQGIGVLAAITAAGRDEFFMVGGAGSRNAMEAIQAGDTPLQATVIYPSTQAADGIALARLIAQGKTAGDLITPSVPNRIVLDAPVVTKDNVDSYIDLSFES
ncbi:MULTISPECIES: substrate-binding domain-containing protein [unclassified Microbacterium]|uniref:substrate-binding domain-containing protein n=1 Tax=unclassified Microbacterium TaxID=2609290 RepID=UPI0006F72B60|nr:MULTISPECIES: substrate-binding domain-containing protein [unclassified Microbacterium]AOX46276.1 sugar ABC transporter substrate-binding protein [Microbacterium sp. BH-3-3-3]KQT75599.1 sugar ABC transporter substrate-binding protein [Microbacterium sp. Leaf436]MBD8205894.1 substrate-binding domain-containing protein [Microbacterium sp. CFBP 8801]MBD8217794.1 substrate-binding domain-containing protein [Microbacterium sp. CFBP 13617]MBD8476671.1 substrate-binding domain-containing protein [